MMHDATMTVACGHPRMRLRREGRPNARTMPSRTRAGAGVHRLRVAIVAAHSHEDVQCCHVTVRLEGRMPVRDVEGQRLLEWLRTRRLADGSVTRWGQPALRRIERGHEPQRGQDASSLQRRFVACAYGTPTNGGDLCAAWVEQSFSRLGLGVVLGDARYLYMSYCSRRDTADLLVGMIVAVPASPYTPGGRAHGHVGIYAGDATIIDAVSDGVRKSDAELWLSAYGVMAEPRWGWLGSMGLT